MGKDKLSYRQRISRLVSLTYSFYLRKVRRIDLGTNCQISWRATIDRANPKGVHIGDNSRVALEALIIAHDYSVVSSGACSVLSVSVFWLTIVPAHSVIAFGIVVEIISLNLSSEAMAVSYLPCTSF